MRVDENDDLSRPAVPPTPKPPRPTPTPSLPHRDERERAPREEPPIADKLPRPPIGWWDAAREESL